MPALQFKGKTAVENYHHTVPHHILEFDRHLSVLGNAEKPALDGNLIIEGDNLLALKALLPTHAGRIKCVYIDPPYNTGNEGWVFNDNLTQPQFKEWIGQTVGKEGEDATRHDKWCCMMYPRLQLLKQLLRDDGAIFISIDDIELHNLRMMMDEIFGPENFIANFIYHSKRGGGNAVNYVVAEHEYVLCFACKINECEFAKIAMKAEDLDQSDEKGPYRKGRELNKWGPGSRREDRPSMFFPVPGPGSVDVYPIRNDGTEGRWRRGRPKMLALARERDLVFEPRPDGTFIVYEKIRSADPRLIPYRSILTDVGVNADGTRTLKELFGAKVFESPKPVKLISHLVSLSATDEDDIVLDSYAGSGTTGQAVLELNKQDGGNRRFILVQLPYDNKDQQKQKFNICRKVAVERMRRVIEGYTFTTPKRKRENVAGLESSFSFCGVGAPLFGEYRDLGEKPPAYEELAKYIFYTETSKEFDKNAVDQKSGKIGEYRNSSYYLLYSPNGKEGRALDTEWLNSTGKFDRNKNLVVYCEKLWVHRDDLARYEAESGHTVRPMIVPFTLK